jgi:hypothetical protein
MDLELSVLNPAEADAAMAVVKESFEACVAPDYAQQGRDLFAQVVTADYLCSLPHRQGWFPPWLRLANALACSAAGAEGDRCNGFMG